MKTRPAILLWRGVDSGASRGEIGKVAVVMLLLTLALYARTFGADWTYDDGVVIVNNPDVKTLSGFFADSYPGRPLRELSLLLDHTLFGLKPAGWHAQNIFWHAISGFLCWFLLLRLGLGRGVAWATALLFLLHPLNVEVVASLSHRKDSLALAFSLLTLLVWLQSYVATHRPWRWRLGALLLWLVALSAKEHALLLPLLAATWELCALPAERRWLLRWPRLWWFAAGAAGSGFVGWLWLGGGAARFSETARLVLTRWHEYDLGSAGYYPWMLLKSWVFMGSRLVWPSPLAIEYHYPVPHSFFDSWVLAGAGLVTAFAVLLLVTWRLDRRYFFGLAWFGLFWLPTSNLWPLTYFAADRYFYMPALGLFLCVALLIEAVPVPLWRRRTVLVLLVAPLALLSWQQVRYWHNDETLYLHALEVSPRSAFVCNELGKLYVKRGEGKKAFDYYQRGHQNDPRNASLLYNLGALMESMGLWDRALDYYRLFLRLDLSGDYAEIAGKLRQRLHNTYGVDF